MKTLLLGILISLSSLHVHATDHKSAFKLYSELKKEPGNLFFSPLSIKTGLELAYLGAKGKTADQLKKVLGFGDGNAARESLKQLNTANAIWGQKDFSFEPSYLKRVQDHMNAKVELVDFADAETTKSKIDAWVETETKEMIKDLIADATVIQDARLVLTNAIYFKGKWEHQFKKEKTVPGPFFVEPKKEVTVKMMSQTETFLYGDDKTSQWISLPYEGNDLTMFIVLPSEGRSLAEIERSLTAKRFAKMVSKLRNKEVMLTIPTFKTSSAFSLVKPLKKIGITDAFDSHKANFNGIAKNESLFISNVLHKAFVDVYEEGTEAAAATAIIMTKGALNFTPFTIFKANRPFIYLIRERKTNSILFMGRLVNPNS